MNDRENDNRIKDEGRQVQQELEDQLRGWLPQSQKAVEQLKALEPGAASLAKYLYGRGCGFPVYQNTAMTYFPGGEAKFEELLRQLETAEEYIFV